MKPLLQKSRNDIFCSANLEKYFSLRNLFYKKLKLPSFFISMFCLILSFVLQFNTATAQFLGCRGCTASDDHIDSVVLVQINPAYATDPTQPQYINFPPICSGNSTVTGYLKIAFNQNATTRYGISLTGNILVDGVYSSTFTYCNSDETNSGPFVKYISNFPINFTCGTKLELENLFVGWGNSSDNNVCPIQGNICSLNSNNDNNPHCEQLPLTPGGPPIVIVTPLSADFSATGSCSASQTAQSYSFNALDVINGTTGGTLPYPANAYSWTITNSSNVQVATMTGSNPTYNFSTLGTGTYSVTLTVTDDNPTATSSKSKEVTVISCCNLSAPTSDGDQTECAKSPIQTLTATATGGTITWYDAASGGNIVTSPTLNSIGTVTYYAQSSDGTCASLTRTAITLKINAAPATPTSGGDQTECVKSPVQTLTTTATGGTITWYDAASGGNVVASPTLSSVGSVTYYAQSSDGTCTSLTRTAVTLKINSAAVVPTSGGDKTECAKSPIQTLTATATGGTITWYDAASGGNIVASPTLSSVGSVTYYAQSSDGTCTSLTRTAVNLKINAAPAAPTSGGNQTECAKSPIQTLTATATGGTITWYDAASGGNIVASPTLSSVGSVTYYAQSSDGPCTSLTRTAVTLKINAAPATPTSGGDQTECVKSPVQTLTATATGGTITWYDADSGGNIVTSPTLSSVGSVTYYAQSSNGTCASLTRTAVILKINPLPTISGTLNVCVGATTQLTGSPIAASSNPWVSSAASKATVSSTGLVTGVASGQSNITYTNSNGCSQIAAVTVNPNTLCASYNGDYFANTASTTTGGSAIVTLIYNISSDPNVSCNNINALTANDFNFTIIPDNTVGSVILVPNSKTYTNGVLTIKYTITLSPSAYSGTVQFTLGTSGNFTIDPDCADNPLITVSTKVDGFVTGGGFIIPGKSGGSIGGSPVNGLRNNFGFNIKLNKDKLQGNWNTIIRRREAGNVVVYQVKSNVAKTMVITKISNTSYRADLSYTSANFQNLTCSLCPVNANNGTVLVSVYDNGEPGANIDQILITIKDKNGNVWYTSDATANHSLSYTNLQLLNQGNIQIHATGTKMATTLRPDATLTQSALSRMDAASTTPATEFNLVALPNPSQTDFTLQVQSLTREKMQLKVADITGRTIQIIQNISAGQTLKLGSNYKPGVYLIELKQGNNRKQLKLVKL